MNLSRKFLRFKSDESGSISILIMGLFIILLTTSLGIIDISDAYLAKRELTSIGESAISVAAQSLDENRYYTEGLSSVGTLVPIDCAQASSKFQNEIMQAKLRQRSIAISNFTCEGDQVSADIYVNISPAVRFPIINRVTGNSIKIQASVGAGSVVK